MHLPLRYLLYLRRKDFKKELKTQKSRENIAELRYSHGFSTFLSEYSTVDVSLAYGVEDQIAVTAEESCGNHKSRNGVNQSGNA